MLHRIRLAMQNGTMDKLSGEVEADETLYRRQGRNMHPDRKRKRVAALAAWQGDCHGTFGTARQNQLKHVANAKRNTVQYEIRQNVEAGSQVFTDALPSYNGLNQDYVHESD